MILLVVATDSLYSFVCGILVVEHAYCSKVWLLKHPSVAGPLLEPNEMRQSVRQEKLIIADAQFLSIHLSSMHSGG